MTKSGKTIRIGQAVQQVSVPATLLPKTRASVKAGVVEAGETAKVNIVAPVTAEAAAIQKKLRQHSAMLAGQKLDAAIDAGTISAQDAKRIVVAAAARRIGSVEAAEKWYRSHHIAELGGRTAAQMVRAGELKALIALLRAEAASRKA